jgi:signal transduction histidine kinase
MSAARDPGNRGVAAFRRKFLAGMILVIVAVLGTGLYLAERNVVAEAERDAARAFAAELSLLRTVRDLRHATLAERCRALVHKPRLHAALEDDALDLLYLTARDEMQDLTGDYLAGNEPPPPATLRATFYRFLDIHGTVIPAGNAKDAGSLSPSGEERIRFEGVPRQQQTGCIAAGDGDAALLDVIATPITSSDTGEPIAALVVGFRPVKFEVGAQAIGIRTGMWVDEKLRMEGLSPTDRAGLEKTLQGAMMNVGLASSLPVKVGETDHLLFFHRLNPGSLLPPVSEVGLYDLSDLRARQHQLRWRVLGVGAVLMLAGAGVSFLVSARLAKPVRELAIISEENRILRERAEAALLIKTEALQRTARFSADASHQLKTPVTVLRAGLDEILASEELPPRAREEIGMLVHQTFRLTSMVDDLLLLSRLDSSRLKLELGPVNLTQLVETCVDDLGLLPDPLPLEIETKVQADLCIAGERRYTLLILQNLFENARKYNRQHGRIRVTSATSQDAVLLRVANTGHSIPLDAQERIFERFHRGTMGETIPGHGLGLNLARELARIHGGDLRLTRSDGAWTEFEVRFVPYHGQARDPEAA